MNPRCGGVARVCGFGLAVGVLVAAGSGELAPPPASVDGFAAWLDDRGTAVAAAALLRLAALAVAGWLAAACAAVALARAAGAARLAAAVERRALPARLRAATVVSAVAVAAGSPAAAQAVDTAPGTARLSVLVEPSVPTTTTSTTATTAPATSITTPTTPAPAAAEDWVVAPGESFWSIAEEVVADALGRAPTDAEVTPYWRRLIEANRDRLISDNPDLVRPGQVFVVPPVR